VWSLALSGSPGGGTLAAPENQFEIQRMDAIEKLASFREAGFSILFAFPEKN